MKLRNKKTGDIRKAEAREDGIYLWDELTGHWWKYELDLLASGWEYYVEPAEPLIKDEKIRKAVRAWAEATGTTSISYWGGELESEQNDSKIEFDDIAVVEFGDNYAIADLCGEEEE